ncbi:MAG: putative Ig domain-containing protein [Sedimentisphaerales bacterium]|nr:putative Ig domain-containing protein [Sedimentisphaerales bacterium]
MVTRKHDSHIAFTSTIGLVWLILSAMSNVALSAWQTPIGIPAPSFGINETVDMYTGQQYTFTDGRGTIDYPISSVSGKPYTHYVDNTHPDATDTNNPYGTESKPRLTLPTGKIRGYTYITLEEGSVVEVHGGPYDYNYIAESQKLQGIYAYGTSAKPVFIRGIGMPSLENYHFRARGGHYLIVENFRFYPYGCSAKFGWNVPVIAPHHISIRNNEMEGAGEVGSDGGSGTYGSGSENIVNNVVIYNNHIHHYGDYSWTGIGDKNDAMGVGIGRYSEYVWIVDNHIHHNGGDSIHVGNSAERTARYIYIGRNNMHDDRENAIDVKEAQDVIISQNTMYNYTDQGRADNGIIAVTHQGSMANETCPKNIWWIFNEMYNATYAAHSSHTGDEIYFIGNVIHDISSAAFSPYNFSSNEKHYYIGNTLYNMETGIGALVESSDVSILIANNIFDVSSKVISCSTNPETIDMDYNLLYQSGSSALIRWGANTYTLSKFQSTFSEGLNCVEGNPLFVDPSNNDFHLQLASPAINAGSSSGVVKQVFDTFQKLYGIDIQKDIEGNPRTGLWDIGAYEGSSSDPGNPSPALQPIGNKTVNENTTLTFNINATDSNGDTITYSAIGLPSGATLTNQTFSWTPSYTQAGSYAVTFRASDGNTIDSETITITVKNINRAPVLGVISDQSVNENALLSFSVNATDPDNQSLIFSVSSLPNGAVFTSQILTWTPSYDQAGTFTTTFTVDDGQTQDSQAMTITVVNVNRVPVLTAVNNQSVWSGDAITFTIDAIDPDNDTITYSAGTVPTGATFANKTFDWTPSQAQNGNYQVTFYASDGQLQDSQTVTISVNVDNQAPTVTNSSPAAGAIQVPLNNLISLNITDTGKGIDPASVKIKVRINNNPNNNTIYSGDTDHYTSSYGDCRRVGSNTNYKLVYQPIKDFLYNDQTITVTVDASDTAGNVMNTYTYSFVTEMHIFGQNKSVTNTNTDNNDKPVTVCDRDGNIWAAWQTGSVDSRDIYIGKRAAGSSNFGNTIQLTNNTADQCNPAIALDDSDKLYVVWQDNRDGDWDIYISTSVDGVKWSTETRINDLRKGNQINPAVVIDSQSPNYAHVVWQDDNSGNQDIYIAASNNGFITKTISQITSDISDQIEPTVAVDSANIIYVVWTDNRSNSSDIYGAASNNGPWQNVAVINNAHNQSNPVIAAESTGSIIHLLWIDDTPGNNDIYYASSKKGFQGISSGTSIIDDTSGADQLEPTITITGATSTDDLKVFACWQDRRNTDTDIYFTELSAGSGTNIFVNDSGSNAQQSEPAIGIDKNGNPYLMWADDRNKNTDICFTASTCTEPVALASSRVNASSATKTIVGVDPTAITNTDDVSIELPSGACPYDVDISIVSISNRQEFTTPCLGSFEFGPSGIQFDRPVTITIPYIYSSSNSSAKPYWFNSMTGTLSQQGITNILDIAISPTLHAVRFETTHFTPYYVFGGGGGIGGIFGGGGGGGCSLSYSKEGSILEYFLPYGVLALFMVSFKWKDRRNKANLGDVSMPNI